LDLGEAFLGAGAEIGRVEDSLSRVGRAMGATDTEAFVITSSIVLTLEFQDGSTVTGTRRIRDGASFDFSRIIALNSLCRAATGKKLTLGELEEGLKSIRTNRPDFAKLYLGSALAAGSFCLFFGGGVWDAVFSALFGLLICLMQRTLSHRFPNQAMFLFLTCLVSGTGIFLLGDLFSFLNTDRIIIGDIMLVVPGIAITVAARDMVIGDTISGITKLLESLLRAGAVAAGFMAAFLLVGGI
jgi:uncharacterized membrane protein YjjP (DUF1212 family)